MTDGFVIFALFLLAVLVVGGLLPRVLDYLEDRRDGVTVCEACEEKIRRNEPRGIIEGAVFCETCVVEMGHQIGCEHVSPPRTESVH